MRDTTTNKNTGTVSDGAKISATNTPASPSPRPALKWDDLPSPTNKASTNAQPQKPVKK
jgi:hypothetical protein